MTTKCTILVVLLQSERFKKEEVRYPINVTNDQTNGKNTVHTFFLKTTTTAKLIIPAKKANKGIPIVPVIVYFAPSSAL